MKKPETRQLQVSKLHSRSDRQREQKENIGEKKKDSHEVGGKRKKHVAYFKPSIVRRKGQKQSCCWRNGGGKEKPTTPTLKNAVRGEKGRDEHNSWD